MLHAESYIMFCDESNLQKNEKFFIIDRLFSIEEIFAKLRNLLHKFNKYLKVIIQDINENIFGTQYLVLLIMFQLKYPFSLKTTISSIQVMLIKNL